MRLLATSDIHGEKDKLVKAMQLAGMVDENCDWIASHVNFVFCGDYIDRGPDSKGVIDTLLKWEKQAEEKTSILYFLMGNHEKMLIDAEKDDMWHMTWLSNGGKKCIESYNAMIHPFDYAGIQEIYKHHEDFLMRLMPYVVVDDTMFVHGGVVPERNTDSIGIDDAHLWIRDAFYKRANIKFIKENYNVNRIVFGHSVHNNVTAYHNGAILAIDTGAPFSGGKISIVELGAGLNYTVVAQV